MPCCLFQELSMGFPKKVLPFLVQDHLENYAIMSLAAYLGPSGHSIRLVPLHKKELQRLAAQQPPLVAVSALTPGFSKFLKTITWLRRASPRTTFLVGGQHATFAPEIIDLPGIDLICRGEGEEALHAVVTKKPEDWADIPNILVAGEATRARPPLSMIEELDSLPFPERSLHASWYRRTGRFMLMATRGCQHGCRFCANGRLPSVYGRTIPRRRTRSPENVLAEITLLEKQWKVRRYDFVDATLNQDRDWFLAFLDGYARGSNTPFSCDVRIDSVGEVEVAALVRAGCRLVKIGLEVGDETFRREQLGKHLPDRAIEEGCTRLRRAKIPYLLYCMYGFPGETYAVTRSTVTFAARLAPDFSSHFLFLPLPGLALTDHAQGSGLLPGDFRERALQGNYSGLRSILEQEGMGRICNLHKFSALLTHHPRALRLVDLLTRLPENRLFDLLFQGSAWLEVARRDPFFAADLLLRDLYHHRG